MKRRNDLANKATCNHCILTYLAGEKARSSKGIKAGWKAEWVSGGAKVPQKRLNGAKLGRSEISDFNAPGVEISAFNAFNAFAITEK